MIKRVNKPFQFITLWLDNDECLQFCASFQSQFLTFCREIDKNRPIIFKKYVRVLFLL